MQEEPAELADCLQILASLPAMPLNLSTEWPCAALDAQIAKSQSKEFSNRPSRGGGGSYKRGGGKYFLPRGASNCPYGSFLPISGSDKGPPRKACRPDKEDTIAHKKITELIPKQFRFGNVLTKITEDNSQNNSVSNLVILCSHHTTRRVI